VAPSLIKRQKQHFHHVPELGVDVIFGCNGLVWVGVHVEPPKEADVATAAADPEAAVQLKPEVGTVPVDVRTHVALVANVVRVLSRLFLPIHLPAVLSLATVRPLTRHKCTPRASFASSRACTHGESGLSTKSLQLRAAFFVRVLVTSHALRRPDHHI
jgi:hypothetical protein